MWRWWWWWGWDEIEPNPSEERPVPPVLGPLHPLLLHHPPPSPNEEGGQLAPGPFEPQNQQLQQHRSPQTKGSSETEALCPPAPGQQGEAKRVRGRRFGEEHTKQQQQTKQQHTKQHEQQQDTEAEQLGWNQEVGLDLLSGGREMEMICWNVIC